MNNDEKIKIMRDEKISTALWKLGLPTMIGMLVSALYNVVDAYFVGGLGTAQMGAVSITFPIAQIIIGLGMTFGTGAASYISRLLGEGKSEKANQTASMALFTSLAVGAVAITASLIFLDPLLISLGATETILPYARMFAVIYFLGAILNVFNVTMNNIVTAEGAAKLTMTSMLLGGGLNALFNPLFIYTFGWGIRGSALATVAAQLCSMGLYLWYLGTKRGFLQISLSHFRFDANIMKEIIKIGVPVLVFQLLTSTAIGMTNTAASSYGDSAVAAMGIVTRLLSLGTFVIFGYMKGFQPIAGYNFGANRLDRLDEAIKVSLRWATIFCSVMACFMIFFPAAIVSLFSSADAVLVDIGSKALRANGFIFIFFGFQMLYGSLFLALGKAIEGGILSMSRQGIFFIPLILILPHWFGIDGIIYVQPAADALTLLLSIFLAVRLRKELRSNEANLTLVAEPFNKA